MNEMMLFLAAFMSGLFNQGLSTPPRDLASLADPKAAVISLQQKADEDSLIALLKTASAKPATADEMEKALTNLAAADFQTRRTAADALRNAGQAARTYLDRGAKSDDPEVRVQCTEILKALDAQANKPQEDYEYVKRLMAIRVLEGMKSPKAVPVLEGVANGTDVTLADAAKEAAAIITGKSSTRPTGKDIIMQLSKSLPADLGFIGVLDAERGSRTLPLSVLQALLLENLQKKGLNATLFGGQQAMDRITMEAENGIVEALAVVGNVRCDAVLVLSSADLGDRQGYIGVVLKGLCDVGRMKNVIAAEYRAPDQRYEWNGRTVFNDSDTAWCVLDQNTVVAIAGAPQIRQNRPIEKILAALTAKPAAGAPGINAFKDAFDLVTEKQMRFAASGALSGVQKNEITAGVEPQLRQQPPPGQPLSPSSAAEQALAELCVGLDGTEEFLAFIDDKGIATIRTKCTTKEAAEKLMQAAGKVDATLMALLAGVAQRDEDLKPLVTPLIEAKKLFDCRMEDKTIEFNGDPQNVIVPFLSYEMARMHQRRGGRPMGGAPNGPVRANVVPVAPAPPPVK